MAESAGKSAKSAKPEMKRLYRSKDKILGGVCSGMAEYFDTDPSLIRLFWVLLTLLSLGAGLLLYIIAWAIIPPKK